jgi:hypothetical protein
MSYQQVQREQEYRVNHQTPPLPPVTPPRRKSRTWIWMVALVIAYFIGMLVGSTVGHGIRHPIVAQPTSVPHAGNTVGSAPVRWKTTQTFTGNGAKKTDVFHVSDTWKLAWKCDPSANTYGQYNVIVGVNNSDGTMADPAAVNTMCKKGNTSGTTTEHQGGDVYLAINSEDTWTLTIQEQR